MRDNDRKNAKPGSDIISTLEVKEERGHCGAIRKLVSEGPARIIHLQAKDAERHYHKKTTEYYYVLDGHGKLYLDGEIRPIQKGDLVRIEPGTVHQAMEEEGVPLEILVVEVPPAIGDAHVVAK